MGRALTAYDRFPVQRVTADDRDCAEGWADVVAVVSARARVAQRCVVAVECYPGVFVREVRDAFAAGLAPALVVDAEEALAPADELERRLIPYLGDDPVFGFMCPWGLEEFFAPKSLDALRRRTRDVDGLVLVVGTGASLARPTPTCSSTRTSPAGRSSSVSALTRSATSARATPVLQRDSSTSVRSSSTGAPPTGIELAILDGIDYSSTRTVPNTPRLIAGNLYRRALEQTSRQTVPCHAVLRSGAVGRAVDEERSRSRPDDAQNYAWCFDCVPEENSLLLGFGTRRLEIPAIDLVLRQPAALLGDTCSRAFGAEFPIRFDFLDTMGGGNLSLQVHPLTPLHPRAVRHALHAGRELLPARRRSRMRSSTSGSRNGVDPEAMIDGPARRRRTAGRRSPPSGT